MRNLKAVLSVKFNSTFNANELLNFFEEDFEKFRNVPGLLQKYFVNEDYSGAQQGIYIFETRGHRAAFWTSELAKHIPSRYGMIEASARIEQFDLMLELNGAVLI